MRRRDCNNLSRQVLHWCSRPVRLANISVSQWRNISGQGEESCRLYDLDWDEDSEGEVNSSHMCMNLSTIQTLSSTVSKIISC